MNHHGDFFGQTALQHAAAGILTVLFDEGIDSLFVQRGEYLDVALGIVVADVEPELIELVGSGALRVEPDVSALGLAEFLAVGLGDKRTGECEGGLGVVAQCAANQFRTGGHVAPLVVAAQLQAHAFVLIEIEEVVALQQLVGEFGERQSVAGSSVESLLHAFLGHHVVDGDVLTHLAREVEEGEILHPVVVVHQLGSISILRLEVEELGHLLLDALLVVIECLVVEQVTLLTLARGVANHTRCASHQDDGLVAAALQMAQHHDATKVSDMEGIGRGVGAKIGCHHLFL